MARVELMLRENLRQLGKVGDMVSVAPRMLQPARGSARYWNEASGA